MRVNTDQFDDVWMIVIAEELSFLQELLLLLLGEYLAARLDGDLEAMECACRGGK